MSARLIVISGPSGTGKSTLARSLQEALLPDVWLHFSADSIFDCLPRSIVERANRENDWSLVDSALNVNSAYACTRTLIGAGHRVIYDGVILSERGARSLMSAFGEFAPILVGLTCSWEETKRRTLLRGDRTLEEAEHGFRHAAGHLKHDYTFETTDLPPDTMAMQLAHHVKAVEQAGTSGDDHDGA